MTSATVGTLPERDPYGRDTNRRHSRTRIHEHLTAEQIRDLRHRWDYGPGGNNGPETFTIFQSDRKGPWEGLGPMIVRVHEDSTNYDATFYLRASRADEARLRSYPHFHIRIFHRQGGLIWSSFMDVHAPAQNGWLLANIHFDSRWMPNPGVYELRFVDPLLATWREAAVEEYRAWERHNDTASAWRQWARLRRADDRQD